MGGQIYIGELQQWRVSFQSALTTYECLPKPRLAADSPDAPGCCADDERLLLNFDPALCIRRGEDGDALILMQVEQVFDDLEIIGQHLAHGRGGRRVGDRVDGSGG